jgi:hypothetical protein
VTRFANASGHPRLTALCDGLGMAVARVVQLKFPFSRIYDWRRPPCAALLGMLGKNRLYR